MGKRIKISDLMDPKKLEKHRPELLNYFSKGGTWQELLGYDHHVMEMQYQRAYDFYQGAEFGKAAGVFTYLSNLNPYEYRYWMGLGQCKQHEHLFAEAAVSYQLASAIDPTHPAPHVNLAQCYFALQQKKKAVEACKQALTLCGKALKHRELKKQANDLLQGLQQ